MKGCPIERIANKTPLPHTASVIIWVTLVSPMGVGVYFLLKYIGTLSNLVK